VIKKISGVLRAVVATLLMCFSSGPSAAVSGGPTAQIRGHVDEMYRLVSNASERSAADGQAAVRKVADRMFDWSEMARGALGKHWQERTPAEHGSVIAVDYRTRVGERGSWRVYDLDAEGISLVGNYRTQFNSIIVRSSYSELVKRLKAAGESHSGG
jgi:phospholipid transport system substrate-binding protein